MSTETLFLAIVPAIIGGIFTILGVWYGNRLQARPARRPSTPEATSVTQADDTRSVALATTGLRWAAVLRDVGIIWLLTAVGGLIVGIANPGDDALTIAAGLSNFIFGIIGFTVSGVLARGPRWRHLLAVAAGVWLTSFVNIFLLGIGLSELVAAIPFVLVIMAVGGGLSYLFRRR